MADGDGGRDHDYPHRGLSLSLSEGRRAEKAKRGDRKEKAKPSQNVERNECDDDQQREVEALQQQRHQPHPPVCVSGRSARSHRGFLDRTRVI